MYSTRAVIWRLFVHMECRRGLAMRILSVYLSVCLTNAWFVTNRKTVVPAFLYNMKFTLVLWQEEWLVGATPSTWNCGSNWSRWSEIADFQSIFARSASVVASSKKVKLTKKSRHVLSNEPKMIILSPIYSLPSFSGPEVFVRLASRWNSLMMMMMIPLLAITNSPCSAVSLR